MTRHNKRIMLKLILSLAILGLATSTPAQQINIDRQLSQCINEHTLAILQVDVTRIDIDALYDTALKTMKESSTAVLSPEDEADLLRIKSEPKQWQSQFATAGGKTICAMWNTADPLDLLIAVPVSPKANASTLGKLLSDVSDNFARGRLKQTHKDNLILLGTAGTLEKWSTFSPAARPELQQAATTAGSGAVQLFLIPDADTRRVIEALLPVVSEQRITPETNALVKGLQWAAITLDLPPHPSLRLHVESADAASASAMRRTLIESYDFIGQIPQLQRVGKQLKEALASLTPAVKNNTLQLVLDKDKCMDLVTDFVIPAFIETDQMAERITCGTNLSGMGKAILIYANDHDDKFPPTLQTLVDTVEYPRKGLACPSTRNDPDYASYVYRGVDLKGTSCPPTLIVVHDRKGNHRDGRNVLFVDSHVDWVNEEDFADLVKRDNEIRQKYGYKPKSAE